MKHLKKKKIKRINEYIETLEGEKNESLHQSDTEQRLDMIIDDLRYKLQILNILNLHLVLVFLVKVIPDSNIMLKVKQELLNRNRFKSCQVDILNT